SASRKRKRPGAEVPRRAASRTFRSLQVLELHLGDAELRARVDLEADRALARLVPRHRLLELAAVQVVLEEAPGELVADDGHAHLGQLARLHVLRLALRLEPLARRRLGR